jgi:hypothetical protein
MEYEMALDKAAKLKIGLSEISEITGEHLTLIHDAVRAGHIETFLVGRRRFARPEAVRSWVDFLEAQSKAGKPVSYRARQTSNKPAKP